MTKAIYPGTFDPFTYGHLDIIKRGLKIFDHILVAVGDDIAKVKQCIFTKKERAEIIREVVKQYKNVSVEEFDGLLVDFAKQKHIGVILRGIRTMADFEYEFQIALTNKVLGEQIETVFLITSQDFAHIRSKLIKEAVMLGGDVSKFVPPQVAKRLKEKFPPSS